MSDFKISHGKTIYDIYNMINPNCYQAFIIQYIIENKKDDALKCCEELEVAFNYYKWDSSGKQSGYVDNLICESSLEKWQKIAIIHIIANDVKSCKNIILDEIKRENEFRERRLLSNSGLNSHLFDMFGFTNLL